MRFEVRHGPVKVAKVGRVVVLVVVICKLGCDWPRLDVVGRRRRNSGGRGSRQRFGRAKRCWNRTELETVNTTRASATARRGRGVAPVGQGFENYFPRALPDNTGVHDPLRNVEWAPVARATLRRGNGSIFGASDFGADDEGRRESEVPIKEPFSRWGWCELVDKRAGKKGKIKPLSGRRSLHHEPNARNMNNQANITHVCKLV